MSGKDTDIKYKMHKRVLVKIPGNEIPKKNTEC